MKSSDYSHVEVTGEGIFPIIKALSSSVLANILLKKHRLNDVKKGSFYPLENCLSLLKELEERAPAVLRNVGKKVMSEVIFPENIKSFEQALEVSEQAYLMNHRNVKKDEIGHYVYEKISSKEFIITNTSLYPCAFDEGVIYGMAVNFNTKISVTHIGNTCKRNGDKVCKYKITVL